MPLRVHVADDPALELTDLLRPLLDPAVALTSGDARSPGADYDVLVSGRPTPDLLGGSPNLRAVVVPWAGVSRKTQDLVRGYPQVTLHNLHHNAAATAEMAIALLLAAAKALVPMDRALRTGDWRPRYAPDPALELEGKTALVLGLGAIGGRVARACRGLGMTVLGVRRRGPSPAEAPVGDSVEIHPATALTALLPRAQALVICLPLTAETEGLIGEEELARLPAGAILVNIGRGPIVAEEPLYRALTRGHLHAAGLDVWYQYPEDEAARAHTFPSHFPFHDLDQVVLSPHRGGDNAEAERRRVESLAALLNAAARGQPVANRVDLDAGY
jgi:phosphoglycerate dehydrogenase-like enzyme